MTPKGVRTRTPFLSFKKGDDKMQTLYFYFIAIIVTAFSLLLFNFYELYCEIREEDLKRIEREIE